MTASATDSLPLRVPRALLCPPRPAAFSRLTRSQWPYPVCDLGPLRAVRTRVSQICSGQGLSGQWIDGHSIGRPRVSRGSRRTLDVRRRLEAVAFDQPLTVVEPGPGDERGPQLLHGRESLHPQQLLFERADHPLGAAVAFGRTHERWARFGAEEREFVLERIAQVLAAVVVPDAP